MTTPRKIEIRGSVAVVPLTQGFEAIISADDVILVNGVNWCVKHNRNKRYAQRGYRKNGRCYTLLMHTLIMQPPPGIFVDHIDGDGLNNTRGNLRLCTLAENTRNCSTPITNSSGLKGVSFHKAAQKWRAQIIVNQKTIWLGVFDCRYEAHEAYREASQRYHKEFGRTA